MRLPDHKKSPCRLPSQEPGWNRVCGYPSARDQRSNGVDRKRIRRELRGRLPSPAREIDNSIEGHCRSPASKHLLHSSFPSLFRVLFPPVFFEFHTTCSESAARAHKSSEVSVREGRYQRRSERQPVALLCAYRRSFRQSHLTFFRAFS